MGLFRALFIGVNKHADPGVQELNGAVRDAQGLHALFQDTFTDLDSQLLLDAQATIDAIRAGLDRVLDQATENDVVVISFAGHGRRLTRS
jgi:helicase